MAALAIGLLLVLVLATVVLGTVNLDCDTLSLANVKPLYDISLQLADADPDIGISVLVHNHGNQDYSNVTLSTSVSWNPSEIWSVTLNGSSGLYQLYKSYFLPVLDAPVVITPETLDQDDVVDGFSTLTYVLPSLPAERSALVKFEFDASVSSSGDVVYQTSIVNFTPFQDVDFADNGPLSNVVSL